MSLQDWMDDLSAQWQRERAETQMGLWKASYGNPCRREIPNRS
jgi:hypothetical protein